MISEATKLLLETFAQGRKHYKLMEFSKARDMFKKCLEIDPNDNPSKVYLERCEFYAANPPPEDWDGVFVMKTK